MHIICYGDSKCLEYNGFYCSALQAAWTCVLCLLRLHTNWKCNQSRGRERKSKTGDSFSDCIIILMPVAVHNAVNCFLEKKTNILSSFMTYKYMYVLHLTEVLLINTKNEAVCVCECLREKLWLPLNIKQHVSYREKTSVLFFFIFFLSFF